MKPLCSDSNFDLANGLGVFETSKTVVSSITNPGKFVIALTPDSEPACKQEVSAYKDTSTSSTSNYDG
jgi:hypothetical protein